MLKRLLKSASGNVLMLAGLAMPILIGSGGLIVDTIQWTLWRQQLQRTADSAAMAGAFARAQDRNVPATVTGDLAKHLDQPLTGAPTVQNPPSTGPFAGNTDAVRVVLTMARVLPFTNFFMPSPPSIRAEATAAILTNGNYCVIALEDTATAGITIGGNATVNLNCGMATNSTAANAVTVGGSSSVISTPVHAVGGLTASGNYQLPTTLLPYSLPQADPFEGLPTPTVSSCNPQRTVGSNETATLSPGCYRGITIRGTVTFQPGVYMIDGGDLDFGSQAEATGSGVTFILTSATAATTPSSIGGLEMNGGAELNLSAPTSGTYSGVLVYQDRRALLGVTNRINGNSDSTLQGAFYFPRQALEFNGTSGMTTDCVQLVSRTISWSGNSSINNSCPPASDEFDFRGSRVRLVG